MKIKSLLCFFITCLVITSSFAQDYVLKFEITNDTGIDLFGVYVTPSAVDNWGEDIIPGDTFDADTTVTVTIPVNSETLCVYDIKVTDYADEGVVFSEIDFCELSKLVFYQGTDGQIYYSKQ